MSKRDRQTKAPPEITKPVFYLDWNVISYLQDSSSLDYEHRTTLLCLKQILGLIDRSSMITPYSYAHLADIRQGPKDRHYSWLTHLESTSGGWQVREMSENRDRIALFKTASLIEDFSQYDSEQTESECHQSEYEALATVAFDPIRAEVLRQIDKLEKNPNAEILLHATNVLLGENMITGLEILRFNKVLRNRLRNQEGIRIRYPDAKNIMKTHPDKPFRELVDESISKSGLPWNTYDELEKAIPFIGTGGFLSQFMQRVNRLSTIANMLGIGLDKLKKDTAFRGFVNDLGHLSLGLRCHYLISEDSALIEKAVFIKNMLELPIVVLRAEGLNRLLLSQIAPYYVEHKSANTSEEGAEVTFRFTGHNGEKIKTYVVKTN